MDECTIKKDGAEISSSVLLDLYTNWSGDVEMTAVKFSRTMIEKGVAKERATNGLNKGRVVWREIGLLE